MAYILYHFFQMRWNELFLMMKYTLIFLILIIFFACESKSEELIVSKTNTSMSTKKDVNAKIEDEDNDKIHFQDSKIWQGRYSGILPCSDCDGIEIIIFLKPKKKYTLQMSYLNSSEPKVKEKGSFSWLDANNILFDNEEAMEFMVSEDRLWLLKSKRIPAMKLANNAQYILQKNEKP
ncbi:lipoprotein involved with copper homeostasis and adhesion [Candidatus Ornithobacterium hominis]|nr:lipoprotein involved with copper homeostasis and adhesion [Candidatus Ornithobacterium hominis]